MNKSNHCLTILAEGRQWFTDVNKMKNRQDVTKAFRKARIVGEQKLSSGEINWEQYAATMVGFELQLKEMGVQL